MNINNKKRGPTVAICAAFAPGWEIMNFASDYPYPISLVATSPRDDQYEERIAELCEQRGIRCIRKADVNSREFLQALERHGIDLVILGWWPSIIKKQAIQAVRHGWVNLHPSLLPYNRGKHPFYWSIIEGTPFGVTIHLIDEGVDTGPILFQRVIPVRVEDTGESLYRRGLTEILELFKESYSRIVRLDLHPMPQDNSKATFHLAAQLDPHSQIDLDRSYRAVDLINILRARTFHGGQSAFFFREGKKYYVRLSIDETRE